MNEVPVSLAGIMMRLDVEHGSLIPERSCLEKAILDRNYALGNFLPFFIILSI